MERQGGQEKTVMLQPQAPRRKSRFQAAHDLIPLIRALRAHPVSDFEFALLIVMNLHIQERANRAKSTQGDKREIPATIG